MNEQTNSVDFWVDELTKETDPELFNFSKSDFYFTTYKGEYGHWMWNCGYNAGLVNLQTKIKLATKFSSHFHFFKIT